jgi:hypothetical protein
LVEEKANRFDAEAATWDENPRRRLLAGGLPGVDATLEVEKVGELGFAHFVTRLGAAAAAGAVDKVRLGLVELLNLLREILGAEIDVDRVGEVSEGVFAGRANVNQDTFALGNELLKLVGADQSDRYGACGSACCRSLGGFGDGRSGWCVACRQAERLFAQRLGDEFIEFLVAILAVAGVGRHNYTVTADDDRGWEGHCSIRHRRPLPLIDEDRQRQLPLGRKGLGVRRRVGSVDRPDPKSGAGLLLSLPCPPGCLSGPRQVFFPDKPGKSCPSDVYRRSSAKPSTTLSSLSGVS